ncbi:MAG: SURF1 family protein [Mangrovicoccus sp.]|nr:SURF1 family protein [Mangrovicoccus sp.]
MGRIIFPLLFGLAGAALLVWLGLWQLQRLEWKEDVLAQIDARIGAAPVALPARPNPESDRFLPVRVSGQVGPEEIRVQASLKRVGPGYRVIAPLTLDDGRRILLDRGFLPEARKTTVLEGGAMTIEGNLHWPDEQDRYTPEPDLQAGLWFARDLPSLAAHLKTEPVLIVARSTSQAQPGLLPLPVDSAGIPNDHLQYAVTWFGLALVWVVMTGVFLRARLRSTA